MILAPRKLASYKVCPAEVRPAEVCLAEVRFDEACPAEVNMAFGVLGPPGVPDSRSLPYVGEILVVGHLRAPVA